MLFNGDKVYHAVYPVKAGETRYVVSMQFVTSGEMNPFMRFISNMKDAVAYFGLRGVFGAEAQTGAVRKSPPSWLRCRNERLKIAGFTVLDRLVVTAHRAGCAPIFVLIAEAAPPLARVLAPSGIRYNYLFQQCRSSTRMNPRS